MRWAWRGGGIAAFLLNRIKFFRRWLDLVFRAIYMCVICRIPLVTFKGRPVFLSSHCVADHFYFWADKGICLFLLLETKIMKHFERQWKLEPHGGQWKSSPGVWLGFGFGEEWTRSDFSSWSDTLTLFTKKKMVGLGVGCWILILSRQQLSVWGIATDRHSSAHWNTVCLAQYQV